ncbi:3-hydroxy-3-methylglutaryl-coenzyme A reductase [Penicillium taxi]|uniref:3-hydroxy-3-methylglutaryl-coenzyme A reductase n=1 Tax=Penicillium taxi TaxID=168475 RepID=UPI0025452D77|nr:3-hydroxy-3-methylglutaryl-coenzyme A reductase [Penicillium taxi]KAJ5894124.1 3-hydroxy-3-methylglutaryl-coenzyme A reductase [Penicillium taxi]
MLDMLNIRGRHPATPSENALQLVHITGTLSWLESFPYVLPCHLVKALQPLSAAPFCSSTHPNEQLYMREKSYGKKISVCIVSGYQS